MNAVEVFTKKNNWIFTTKITFPGIKALSNVLVIFLPEWSPKDFKIIDSLKVNINQLEVPVYVFDFDQFLCQKDFDFLFPEIPIILSTPVILYYSCGHLKYSCQNEKVTKFFEYLP